MREITLGNTFYVRFHTKAFSTDVPTTLLGTPVISIYEENDVTQITSGVSLTVDFDSVTGMNLVTIVATTGNGFETGKVYDIVITTGTVDGVSVVGKIIGSFSVDVLVKAIWDRVLSGSLHNIADSAGRRIRNLLELGQYEGGGIFIDTVSGVAGTTDYENGTNLNPVDTITDANIIAGSLNLSRFAVASGSTIAFAASQDNQIFNGHNWNLALGGQSVSATHIFGAIVSGICTGANAPEFNQCFIGNVTVPPSRFVETDIQGTIILPVGDVDFHHCAGEQNGVLDFGTTVANTTVSMTNFSGDLTIKNLGQNGTDVLNIRGHGKVTFEASCIGGAFNWDGHLSVTNNGTGITITDDDITSAVLNIFTTAMTESYAADGSETTLAQILYQTWSLLNSLKFVSTIGTSRKLDGVTPAMTFVLDDSTLPTDINRTG